MIKVLLLTIYLLLTHSASAAEIDTNLSLLVERQFSEVATKIDPKIWAVVKEGGNIAIESKSEMAWTRTVSPALGEAPRMAKYRLVLSYAPAPSEEQYLELLKARMPHLRVANYGAASSPEDPRDGKTILHESHKYLEENPLPCYKSIDRIGKSYVVYRKGGAQWYETFKNEGDYFDAKRLEAVLDRVFFYGFEK